MWGDRPVAPQPELKGTVMSTGHRHHARRPPVARKAESSSANPARSIGHSVPFKTLFWISLALIAVNLLIYAQSWNYGFLLYDDPSYVSENLEVSHGLTWQGISWAFTTGHSANWHPLTWLSHMLDVQLYGMHAGYHHLTNLLLHVTNSLVLFWILCRATGLWGRSAAVAFLFAAHPMHVESVAWIAERKDVLSTLLWMLALWAYINYARRPLPRRRAAVILFFALGLMAKPMLVTLPLILLLLDIWPLRRVSLEAGQSRIWRQLVREKIPLFALSVASSIITVIAQWKGGTVQGMENLTLSWRTANAVVSYAAYIGKMLWPRDLIAYYPYEPLSGWLVAISIIVLILISFLILRDAKSHPCLLVGWLWYLCTLLPVIGLIQVGAQARADRYTYIPFIGLFMMLAWGIPGVFEGLRRRVRIMGAITAIVVCISTVAAREQAKYWMDDVALWRHALQSTPENYFAHTSLGIALAARGESAAAIAQYEETLRLRPDSAETHNALGAALFKQGLWREAWPHYEEALRLRPEFAEAHSNMGTVLGMQGKNDEAVLEFLKALKIAPQNSEIRYNLGFSLAKLGRYDEAIVQYDEALKIKPLYTEAYFELGNTLFMQGKLDEAINRYARALEIQPDFTLAHNNLGLALMRQGRNDEAIGHFNEALRIDPNSVQARKNLAIALEKR